MEVIHFIKNFYSNNFKIRFLFVFLIFNLFQVDVYSSDNDIRPFPFELYNSCKNLFSSESKKCSLGNISEEELNSAILRDHTNRLFNKIGPHFYKNELKIELFGGGFYRAAPNSIVHMYFQLYTNSDSKDENYNFSLVQDAWDCSRNYYLSRVFARGPSLDNMKSLNKGFRQYESFSNPDAMPLCNR